MKVKGYAHVACPHCGEPVFVYKGKSVACCPACRKSFRRKQQRKENNNT